MSCLSSRRNFEEAVGAAAPAAVERFLDANSPEDGVRAGSGSDEIGACALGADLSVKRPRFDRLQLLLCRLRAALVLADAALKLRALRLQISATVFKCRVLGIQEPKVLAKHRRTAVLVDELLKKFKWSHGLPVGIDRSQRRVGAEVQE